MKVHNFLYIRYLIMEERNTGEADFISKCVVEDLVKNVINGINDSNAKISEVQDKSAEAVTESLASALESLTEESAREILEEETSKSVLSDKTSTIIKEFMCNESKDKSKPVIVPEEDDDQTEELSLQVSYPVISRNFITIAIIARIFFGKKYLCIYFYSLKKMKTTCMT